MTELYWITRLTSIKGLFIFLAIFGGIVMIWYFLCTLDSFTAEDVKRKYKKNIYRLIVPTAIFALLSIFIPTTREALVIYGIGGTIDYLENNETAKQLPDKVVIALDKYLDELNNKKE